MSALALTDTTVSLGPRQILSAITATLQPGQLVALLGPNGAGKTTLLRAMAGLQAFSGSIRLGGRELRDVPPQARARMIGYLPQGHSVHWPLPARQIVALGRFAHGANDPQRLSAADAAAVDAAMAATGVTDFADRPATALSGGERARVALARVLAIGAPIVLADEPTASLDPSQQLAVMEVLAHTARAGALVIAVSHDLDHALAYADRALVLHQGRLAADGKPFDVLNPTLLADVFQLRDAHRDASPRWQRLG